MAQIEVHPVNFARDLPGRGTRGDAGKGIPLLAHGAQAHINHGVAAYAKTYT